MPPFGAVRSVGNATCHFVTYRNGTGCVTFLQSTIPSLTYGCFDYATDQKDIEYARQFSNILWKDMHTEEDYNPEDYISERESAIREIYNKHCVYAACKGQGGDDSG